MPDPSRVIAWILSVVLVEIPVIQGLRFANLDFYPWAPETSLFLSFTAWAFLHTALVAWGALRVRPRPGRGVAQARFLAPVVAQATIWLLVWSVLVPLSWFGAGPRFEPGPLYALLSLYWLLGAPLLAGLQALSSRRVGLLVLGQLVPLVFLMFALATGLGFTT